MARRIERGARWRAGSRAALLALALTLTACGSAPTRERDAPPGAGDAAAIEPAAGASAPAAAADQALTLVGRPYRYGGATPAGFDCSGLVHYSFARVGLRLPRETDAQRLVGTAVNGDELAKGDLVFFDQEGRKASHVGIYLGDGRFVHAPSTGGRVRVDRFDSPYWRRHFNEARRL